MTFSYIRGIINKSQTEFRALHDSRHELKVLNEELSDRVKERTRELERMMEERTETFINLVHETKTPLTLLNSYLERYIQKKGNDADLEIIKSNTEKLTRDIVNLFDIERLEKGFQYDHEHTTDISYAVSKQVGFYRILAEKKKIDFTSTVENNLIIQFHPEALQRVINNLMENAIKYTPEYGKVRVSLGQKGDEVVFSVADSGIGIPQNLQDRIFEPYHRLNENKRNIDGMGLGLSIVKKILDSADAHIRLSSEVGKGSDFKVIFSSLVKIPVQNVVTVEDKKISYLEITDRDIPDRVRDNDLPSLLIVEDNINLLRYLSDKLSEKFNVYVAKSGNEAVSKIKLIPQLDLVISDIMMDDGDGFYFYREMVSSKRYEHLPFIFLTAKTDIKDRISGLGLGAVDYIDKPFRMMALEAKITSLLTNLEKQREAIVRSAYQVLKSGRMSASDPDTVFRENCTLFQFTKRETEICHLVKEAKTYKEISNVLHISERTVTKHISNILAKASASSRADLIRKLTSER